MVWPAALSTITRIRRLVPLAVRAFVRYRGRTRRRVGWGQPRQNAYNWRRAAEKFEGVELGETAVVVYTEALAIGLEKLTGASINTDTDSGVGNNPARTPSLHIFSLMREGQCLDEAVNPSSSVPESDLYPLPAANLQPLPGLPSGHQILGHHTAGLLPVHRGATKTRGHALGNANQCPSETGRKGRCSCWEECRHHQ